MRQKYYREMRQPCNWDDRSRWNISKSPNRHSPIGALAHLHLGCAYAMQSDTAKARAAYQDFLTLWENADPDIPILKQTKAEYGKLQ